MRKTIIFLLIIIVVFVIFYLSHDSDSLVLKVMEPGVLHEMKINGVVDKNSRYKVGDEYIVTHKFIFGYMYDRDIEKVE